MSKKRKVVWVGGTPVTPISARERKKIKKAIKKRYDRYGRKYPEVHGKVVDFITQSIEDGTLYIGIRFKDKADFSLRYACDMFIVGADICDVRTGDCEMIREYYALLAGCGPLRVGEALGLEIDKTISPDFRTLQITQKAKHGIIQPYLKTKNGIREVDLCTTLAAMLRDFICTRTTGLLFQSSTGAQLLQSNTLQDSLHPILEKLEHVKGGFNIFRRFRLTCLEKSDCPDALKHFWSGHAQTHVSER